jgi:hypothetical protein
MFFRLHLLYGMLTQSVRLHAAWRHPGIDPVGRILHRVLLQTERKNK